MADGFLGPRNLGCIQLLDGRLPRGGIFHPQAFDRHQGRGWPALPGGSRTLGTLDLFYPFRFRGFAALGDTVPLPPSSFMETRFTVANTRGVVDRGIMAGRRSAAPKISAWPNMDPPTPAMISSLDSLRGERLSASILPSSTPFPSTETRFRVTCPSRPNSWPGGSSWDP